MEEKDMIFKALDYLESFPKNVKTTIYEIFIKSVNVDIGKFNDPFAIYHLFEKERIARGIRIYKLNKGETIGFPWAGSIIKKG